MKKVSIIMPYYNHGEFIEEAVESILAQTTLDYEVIIINDGSTDEHSIGKLEEIRRKHPEFIIANQENSGPSTAKNNGAKLASGEFLLFFDSDNKLLPNYISDALKALNGNTHISWVYSDYITFGQKKEYHTSGKVNGRIILRGNPIDNCIVIRKHVFDSVDGFDPFLNKKGLEDWELFITLLSKKHIPHYIPKACFEYRVNNNSRTGSTANKNIIIIKEYIYKKHACFLFSEYESLYHDYKAVKNDLFVKVGNAIRIPFRFIKNI